jgi:hypothetical protein
MPKERQAKNVFESKRPKAASIWASIFWKKWFKE